MIYYYQKKDEIPILVFLEKLRKDGQFDLLEKCQSYIKYLRIHGNLALKGKYIKNLGGFLYELRPSKARILFSKYKNDYYILNAFIKKTNKTPAKELLRARKYQLQILERLKYEEEKL